MQRRSSMRVMGQAVLSFFRAIALVFAVAGVAFLPSRAVGQTSYTWHNVRIVAGGFITGIVYHPSVQNLVYARTDIGGLYRSTDGGNTWLPLLDWVNWDNWGYSGVLSVAVDPRNAGSVYAAVGGYTNSWDPHNGAILKSTDQGNTWTVAALPFKVGGNMGGRGNGERLAVDPNNSNIIYFGATGDKNTTFGLWKSANGGTSWSQVTSLPAPGARVDQHQSRHQRLPTARPRQHLLWLQWSVREQLQPKRHHGNRPQLLVSRYLHLP